MYYKEYQNCAREAFTTRSMINRKPHVRMLVLSIDYAESTEVPAHTNQEGEMFFLSPLKVGLIGVADEGAEEHTNYLLNERRMLQKCGSGVASMLLNFINR